MIFSKYFTIQREYSRIILFFLAVSVTFNQWFYAQSFVRNHQIFKLLTSLFFWNLIVLLLGFSQKIFTINRHKVSFRTTNLIRSLYWFVFFTFPSIALILLREGFGYNVVEGIKFCVGILLTIAVIEVLRDDNFYLFTLILFIYLSEIIFGVSQLLLGISYSTPENFITIGVSNRWWGLDSIWGTFSLSGKNSYGMCVLLCSIVVLHFAQNTNRVLVKKFLFCTLPFSAISIYYSHSRTAIICVGFLIMIQLWKIGKKGKIFLTSFLVIIYCTVILLVIKFEILPIWAMDSRSLFARMLQQKNILSLIGSNILIGNGYNSVLSDPNNFIGARSLVNSSNSTLGLSTDNFFLRRFLETGVLGEISFMLYLLRLRQLSKRSKSSLKRFSIESKFLVSQVFVTLILASLSFDFLSNQTNVCLFSLILCYIIKVNESSESKVIALKVL